MVEITNDHQFVPPLILVCFIAATVGNLFNHGFYHEIIHMNHTPILDDDPSEAHEKLTAEAIMSSPPVVLNAGTPMPPGSVRAICVTHEAVTRACVPRVCEHTQRQCT